MNRRSTIKKIIFIAAAAIGIAASDWISLAYHALGYPTTAPGQASNVVIRGRYAYAAVAEAGLDIYDLDSRRRVKILPPPRQGSSIDDLSLADGLLFALDARVPGSLSVYSLQDPTNPLLVSGPIPVEVGPFSGVSAAAGKVIVSGGTSRLSLRGYDRDGKLASNFFTADLGRGQPDILLRPDGRSAAVSSHFSGPDFGLSILNLSGDTPQLAGTLSLNQAGFTGGGSKPANFPIEGAWAGQTLLLAQGLGLAFVDLSDLRMPRLLRSLDLGVNPVNVDVEGSLAAAVGSDPQPKLALIDVSSVDRPKLLRLVDLPQGSRPTGVAVGGDRIAVATQEQGVLFFQR